MTFIKLQITGLVIALAFPALAYALDSGIIEEPTVIQNPNPRVPLAAVLQVAMTEPSQIDVSIKETLDGARTRKWSTAFSAEGGSREEFPLVGFRPGATAKIDLTVRSNEGSKLSSTSIDYTAPAVPDPGLDWPGIFASIPERKFVEPGVRIISLRRRVIGRQSWQTLAHHQFSRKWGVLLGLNERGETVWFYKSPARIAGVQTLPTGEFMMTLQDQRTRVIDVLGNVKAEFAAELRPDGGADKKSVDIKGVQTIHHEPYATSRGTMITFSANAKEIENYYTSVLDENAPRKTQMVMGDSLIEYDMSGEIIWRWDSFDHLDPFQVHYQLLGPYWKVRGFPGHLDWTHANGITVDEEKNTIIVSFKHLDALVGIDYPGGDVKWVLGDPIAWKGDLAEKVLKPKGDFVRYPFSPHHPHVTDDGSIVYYDNGMFQAFPFDGREVVKFHEGFSRGVDVRVDEEAMTFEEIWTSEREQTPDSCNNWAMGEAILLPETKNYLLFRAFCPPLLPELSDFDEADTTTKYVDDVLYNGRLDEYTGETPARLVSRIEIRDPNEIIQWQIYGGAYVPSLYWGTTIAE